MLITTILIAATLTFFNTSNETLWFSVTQILADKTKLPVVYVRAHPNPGTQGLVTLDLPGLPGDCFWIQALDRDGPSAPSTRTCVPADGAPPTSPTGAAIK